MTSDQPLPECVLEATFSIVHVGTLVVKKKMENQKRESKEIM
jgi:hypothetical protein